MRRVNFVVLFEGTWNDPDENPSVISKLKNSFLAEDSLQYVFIESGSGTYGWLYKKILGGAKGRDWDDVILAHYTAVRDKMRGVPLTVSEIDFYVFGFSRGAYQAKVFVNGLLKYGLNLDPDEFVDRLRRGVPAESSRHEVHVEYVGLFDTVCATDNCPLGMENVGIPSGIAFRHALAINEYRSEFLPQIMQLPNSDRRNQQWFIGSHSDVGWAYDEKSDGKWSNLSSKLLNYVAGNSPNAAATKTLGKIALKWMLEPCTGLRLKPDCPTLEPFDLFALCHLAVFFPYLIHDSYKSFTNCKGVTRRRHCDDPVFHETVRGVETLLSSNVYGKCGTISVQTISREDSATDVRGPVQDQLLNVAFRSLLRLDGGEVELPVSIIGNEENGRRVDKTVIRSEIEAAIGLYRGKTKDVQRILKRQALVGGSWGSVVRRFAAVYLDDRRRIARMLFGGSMSSC